MNKVAVHDELFDVEIVFDVLIRYFCDRIEGKVQVAKFGKYVDGRKFLKPIVICI